MRAKAVWEGRRVGEQARHDAQEQQLWSTLAASMLGTCMPSLGMGWHEASLHAPWSKRHLALRCCSGALPPEGASRTWIVPTGRG